MKFRIEEKWIDAEQSSFIEKADPKTGKTKYYLEALIVPFGKVSRNGVKYKKEGIERTHPMLVGKPLMHNHVLDGADTLPRGEWVATWIGAEGMYARAEVYNVSYNEKYLEYLKSASSPRVSLQVTGDAEQKKSQEGKFYQEADICDWLEASTVNVPGFDDARASFAVAMAEAFGQKPKKEKLLMKGKVKDPSTGKEVDFEAEVDGSLPAAKEDNTMDNSGDLLGQPIRQRKRDGSCMEEEIAVGKHTTKGGEEIVVHKISGNKAVISGNDAKEKEIDLDALKAILGKESLFSKLNDVREKHFYETLNSVRSKYI